MNMQEIPEGGKRFLSIKVKFFGIYVILLLTILVLISSVLPKIFTQYFVKEKTDELENLHQLIAEVLENEDFLQSPEAFRVLETAAQSSQICIWVCTPADENLTYISVFGSNPATQSETIDFSSFTNSEKQMVKSVLDGGSLKNVISAFPSAFSGNTISIGYPQVYLQTSQVRIGGSLQSVGVQKNGAVFLHISMEGISFASRRLLMIVLAIMFLIVLASVLMTSVMGNNILIPVQEMKDSAAAISKGDFSREVQVTANDEIGQLSQAFNQMTRDLSQVETLQKDFIANISHDFRSPLTSIKGYVEAMLDGTIPQDSYDKYLQIVLDEANRLTKMTNNVLDLTKMENGQIELNRRSFDINELIVGLALSFEQRVEDKKIQIQFQFIQEKLFVYADFDQIQRVIYNLLDNALKFTDEGDSITVETSIIGKKAHISVEDTGCGIEENALPHVFDRFNKGNKSRGKNKLGTGLGLAIAKQIIVNHGEDISVTSHLGEGTKFSFTLPLGTDQRSGKDTGK